MYNRCRSTALKHFIQNLIIPLLLFFAQIELYANPLHLLSTDLLNGGKEVLKRHHLGDVTFQQACKYWSDQSLEATGRGEGGEPKQQSNRTGTVHVQCIYIVQ